MKTNRGNTKYRNLAVNNTHVDINILLFGGRISLSKYINGLPDLIDKLEQYKIEKEKELANLHEKIEDTVN